MAKHTLTVPDIGGAEDAEVIEIYVAVGDEVSEEQSLIVLESDKASMEIPAERAGTVVEILVKEGDTLAEGAAFIVLESADGASEQAPAPAADAEPQPEPEPQAEPAAAPVEEAPASVGGEAGAPVDVQVPDIGTDEAVEVIELMVAAGDEVAEGDSLLVLESDKASMEIPAPFSGTVVSLSVKEGDEVRRGDVIAVMSGAAGDAVAAVDSPAPAPEPAAAPAASPAQESPAATPAPSPAPAAAAQAQSSDSTAATGRDKSGTVYAGPAVRKLAREFGIDLAAVPGSGPKGRILKEDVQGYVKQSLQSGSSAAAGSGSGIPAVPEVDFAAFGEVDIQPLSRIDKVTAANMHRSWLNVPHVTQFDEVDITDLESFRADMKSEGEKRGVKLTPLPFLLKACAAALRDNPKLNCSLAADGEHIVFKQYVHIGMAVDTPAGLVVPVIRDVDQKNLWDLAEETAELAARAKDRKLKPTEMQGACFTISSLGGIGGTGFTPIVNTPEVAILGVSKLAVKPVWNGEEFVPRKMLPLSLSYDHRAVNGGDGGRFMASVSSLLSDIRRLLL